MKCCMHVCKLSRNAKLSLFSPNSWLKFVQCARRWKELSGIKAEKASVACVSLDLDDNSTLKDDMRQRFGYHRECYQRFTDVSKLGLAERLHEARQLRQAQEQEELPSTSRYEGDPHSDAGGEPPSKRFLKRHQKSPESVSEKERLPVFPRECCICHGNRYVQERCTGKRLRERLTACQTLEASKLLEKAAKMTGNHALLLQMKGRDLVASEARYHASCYKDETRSVTKQTGVTEEEPVDFLYNQTYKVFCRDIIQCRIIENKEIFRMSSVTNKFVELVRKLQSLDASSYRPNSLKKRLLSTYPQLQFIQPNNRRESQLVMVRTIQVPDLGDSVTVQSGITPSESEGTSAVDDKSTVNMAPTMKYLVTVRSGITSSESEGTSTVDDESAVDIAHTMANKLCDAYLTARSMQEECSNLDDTLSEGTNMIDDGMMAKTMENKLCHAYLTAKSLREECMNLDATQSCPSTRIDLSLDTARRIVPLQLYNFVAWMIGASEDPVEDRHVEVTDHFDRRILSLAQDIICSILRGRSALPKQSALA